MMRRGSRTLRKLLIGTAFLALLLGVVLVIAFLTPPSQPPAPPLVAARVSEVTSTPMAIPVEMRRGSDRVIQRERVGHPCPIAPPVMGCPASTPVQTVTVYLVRDLQGGLHAFIGDDPRNGCALEWRADITPGVFHDVCHGSLYDRNGRVVGGPSPFNLNQLALTVKDETIYIDAAAVVPGAAGN